MPLDVSSRSDEIVYSSPENPENAVAGRFKSSIAVSDDIKTKAFKIVAAVLGRNKFTTLKDENKVSDGGKKDLERLVRVALHDDPQTTMHYFNDCTYLTARENPAFQSALKAVKHRVGALMRLTKRQLAKPEP